MNQEILERKRLFYQKERFLYDLLKKYKSNSCLHCGDKGKIDSRTRLCNNCITDPDKLELISIVTEYLSMKNKNKKAIIKTQIQEQVEIPDNGIQDINIKQKKCYLCNIILDKNDDFLCKKHQELFFPDKKGRNKKIIKEYRERLIKENRCTSCKKPNIRGFLFYFYIFYEIIASLHEGKKKLVYRKKSCFFCINNHKIRRKIKIKKNICSNLHCNNNLSNYSIQKGFKTCLTCREKNRQRMKRKDICSRCHGILTQKQINISIRKIGKNNIHVHCKRIQMINSRLKYFLKDKIIKDFKLDIRYNEISSQVKQELKNLLCFYYIFQEPFLPWKNYQFNYQFFINKFLEVN